MDGLMMASMRSIRRMPMFSTEPGPLGVELLPPTRGRSGSPDSGETDRRTSTRRWDTRASSPPPPTTFPALAP